MTAQWGIDDMVEFVDQVQQLRGHALTINESSALKTAYQKARTTAHSAPVAAISTLLHQSSQLPDLTTVLDLETEIADDIEAGRLAAGQLDTALTVDQVMAITECAPTTECAPPIEHRPAQVLDDALTRAATAGPGATARHVLWALAIASTTDDYAKEWLPRIYDVLTTRRECSA